MEKFEQVTARKAYFAPQVNVTEFAEDVLLASANAFSDVFDDGWAPTRY